MNSHRLLSFFRTSFILLLAVSCLLLFSGCSLFRTDESSSALSSDSSLLDSSESDAMSDESGSIEELESSSDTESSVRDSEVDTSSAIDSEESSEPELYEGYLGDTMSNHFFDFTVDSCVLNTDYEIAEGDEMWDITVTLTNTTDREQPMFLSDFILVYGEGDNDYAEASIPADGPQDLCMPESYSLDPDQTLAYHLYYEIPADTEAASLLYMEIYSNGTIGDYYSVYLERPVE